MISTIIKFTSGRGWGMTPWDLSNLFQPIKKPVRTLSIFTSMAFVSSSKVMFSMSGVQRKAQEVA
jgi:hypothetical protein